MERGLELGQGLEQVLEQELVWKQKEKQMNQVSHIPKAQGDGNYNSS